LIGAGMANEFSLPKPVGVAEEDRIKV
jgi:hypothetical protein